MDKKTGRVNLAMSKKDIDEFCEQFGYSNDALAAELDVSRATIFNWKKDERNLPRIVSLALWALKVEPRLRRMDTPDREKPMKPYRRNSRPFDPSD